MERAGRSRLSLEPIQTGAGGDWLNRPERGNQAAIVGGHVIGWPKAPCPISIEKHCLECGIVKLGGTVVY